MGKIDTVRTLFEVAKLGVDIGIGIADARRRAREEEERRAKERADAEKDQRIAELEREVDRLREKRKK